ncbi:MAG: hypothetical protein ACFFBR_10320 [Promethearchaeota archaeon]
MSDEKAASSLLRIAAILQILFAGIMLLGFYNIPVVIILQFFIALGVYTMLLGISLQVLTITMMVVGILFGGLWYQWRYDPNEHKTGMIVTGILGALLICVVPGFLILVARAILPSENGRAKRETVW